MPTPDRVPELQKPASSPSAAGVEGQAVPPTPVTDPSDPSDATGDSSPTPSPLTADEQMALFEKELKETDWGHQPC
jgi:hypothetical protein